MAQNQSMKTSMVIFSVLMIQLCCTVFDVSANSSGAPNWTCKTMKPGHGHQPSMPSPFTIDVNPLVITPGSAITVTLKSDGVRFFKGFLVTAFRSTGSGSRLDNLIGKFQGPPGTRETCHGKGYTHRNSQPKSNIVLTWTPPASMSNSDKLVFRVTFVEDHSKYWKDLSSVELTVSSFPDTAPASQSASASKPQPASDNAGAASNTPTFLTEDPKCGIEYSCFHDCYEKQCSFIVTWKDAGHSVAFQLKMMPVAVRERWIAVAFSHDVEMGDDSVTECMVDTQGSVKVYNSYNKAKTNHRLDNKIVGLSKMEGSFVNGLLECKFHRNKTSSYEPKLFDLNKLWYIMFSDGDALAERKFAHRFDIPPPVTSCKVDLRTTAVYVQDTNCLSPERPPESLDGISAGSGYLHVTWLLLILACDVVWLTLPL